LADLVNVPRQWAQTRVVRRLGEEADAVSSAGRVYSRHSNVAAAIIVEAEVALGIDLAEVWAELVRQVVVTSRSVRVSREVHPRVIHAGPRLQRALPSQLPEDRRKAIAIAAARAATTALPDRLDCVVDLGKSYRLAGENHRAVLVFREHLEAAAASVDHAQVIRGYWYEWGISEGSLEEPEVVRAADAWIQGLSLSDQLNPAPITSRDGLFTCAGLGVAFGKLAEPGSSCPFAKARRAAAFIGRLTGPDPRSANYFDRYDREADGVQTPRPLHLAQAIAWLSAGVSKAGTGVRDPFLAGLGDTDRVSFDRLHEVLQKGRA
jgi:hypothetical protein